MRLNSRENKKVKEDALKLERQSEVCSKLKKEIEELKNKNEQLKTSIEQLKDKDKENAEVPEQNNEKEVVASLRKQFEQELRGKNSEISQLKGLILKNEEEIAKLNELHPRELDENNLEDTCFVLAANI